MSSIGAENIKSKYGSIDKIAEAWVQGQLDSHEQKYASEVCNRTDLAAAEIRLANACIFQTRRHNGEIREFKSLKEAMKDAEDLQVWKISFNIPFSDQRIRLVREGDSDFIFQPVLS